MNNKKKIITIVLVFVVMLLGGASIYVATQLSTRQKVAPTAPESKPKADEGDVYQGSAECTVTGVATAVEVPKTCADGAAMSDNFTGTTIDTNKWSVENEFGNELRQANDSLILAMVSTVDRSGASLISNSIEGDFYAQIEVKEATITAPDRSHGLIDLFVKEDGNDKEFGVGLIKDVGEYGEGLFAVFYSAGGESSYDINSIASDSTTKLYLQRTGQELEAFVLKNGEKISLGTETVNFSKPVKLYIYGERSLPAVLSAVLDNFVVSCACTPTEVVTCTPDCPTACGEEASEITTCTNSCGTPVTKSCDATAACAEPVDGEWSTWSACTATACGTSGTKTRTCNNPAPSNGGDECTKLNGTLTTTTARTETATCSAGACGCVPTGVLTCTPDCPTACGKAASVIMCENSCGVDTPKSCPATAACPTGTITTSPTVTESAPTTTVIAEATPTILPETGIFDLPGIAAFGGGLFLAVIGILLAL